MKAELIDHMGSDLTVVNAARVSFDKESEWGLITDDLDTHLLPRDAKLIQYLASHGHWTPFSHPQITMRETVPIFIARQRFKHMVGFTYNEVSRRYVDNEPEFYFPKWRERAANKKQGSGGELEQDILVEASYRTRIDDCLKTYHFLLERGVCPEQARMVLPQSMFTSYYVTGSLAAWARAYKQRMDPHAQQEIQDLAKIWGEVIQPLFPVSWAALT